MSTPSTWTVLSDVILDLGLAILLSFSAAAAVDLPVVVLLCLLLATYFAVEAFDEVADLIKRFS